MSEMESLHRLAHVQYSPARAVELLSLSPLRTLVTTLFVAFLAYWQWKAGKERQVVEKTLAAKYGCQPCMTTVPHKWPFALDVLKKQYDALPKQRLLEFQTPYVTAAGTTRVTVLGDGFIITDPVNLSAILDTNFEDFSLGSRRIGLLPLLGEGIFTQDGHAWKHSRELLRRQFARIRERGITALTPHADELISAIAEEAETNPEGVVDLQPHFFEFTLGTTTDLLFGEPHSSLSKIDGESLRDNFDYASLVSAMKLRLADLAPLYTSRRFRKACRVVREWASHFANKAIDYLEIHGEEAAREKYSFIIDLWLDTRDRIVVRDQLLHVLIAGRDTTACLLSWTFFHLVRNPHLMQRLKDEIAHGIPPGTTDITRMHISQLSFLRCCFNETLRLYPQLPVNVRFANKATVLPRGGGTDGKSPLLLRKGNGVGWSLYHLHRREELYGADARKYKPERWESGELVKKVGLGAGFVDFHGGPRLCLGKLVSSTSLPPSNLGPHNKDLAPNIITYIGVPLAVLGVLPILYNVIRTTSLYLVLRKKLATVKGQGQDVELTNDYFDGEVEVRLSASRIAPLLRDDPRYWEVSDRQQLPGGTWNKMNWKQLPLGHVEVSFDELVTYLLDLGAVVNPPGWKALQSTGIWTPKDVTLLVTEKTDLPVLAIGALDNSNLDGKLSLVLAWPHNFVTRNKSLVSPKWTRLTRKLAFHQEDNEASGAHQKDPGNHHIDVSSSTDLDEEDFVKYTVDIHGNVSIMADVCDYQHLAVKRGRTERLWLPTAFAAYAASQHVLTDYRIPENMLDLAHSCTIQSVERLGRETKEQLTVQALGSKAWDVEQTALHTLEYLNEQMNTKRTHEEMAASIFCRMLKDPDLVEAMDDMFRLWKTWSKDAGIGRKDFERLQQTPGSTRIFAFSTILLGTIKNFEDTAIAAIRACLDTWKDVKLG
ncbi:putative N-alkane-inducible cytochrome P450 [Seiridium unicorne]|uniref:N-alkane-inducible cytochrome P450 n=1 Tax=Seiridium unicorne TaxID=138068 RepID=A0ABR2V384_9PEZI